MLKGASMNRETLVILLKGHLYGLLVLGVVVVLIPVLLKPLDRYLPVTVPAFVSYAGMPIFLAGIVLEVWCLWLFVLQGRGTALPLDPPKGLVVIGPFRYVRNPISIGMLAMILGVALFFTSPVLLLYTIIGAFLDHLYLVSMEEPGLVRRFGQSYEEYRKAVPRWVPRLKGSQGPGGMRMGGMDGSCSREGGWMGR